MQPSVNTVSLAGRALPLPDKLPGDFFLLKWDRELQQFFLYLDDADRSSYKLGGDIQKVMMRFKLWGLDELGNSAIDIAREFGRAQGVLVVGKQKVIPIFDRASKRRTPPLVFKEDTSYAGTLPALR